MNIKQIVEKYLKENGYDGLLQEDLECKCCLDDDLMDCDEPEPDCQPGYKIEANEEEKEMGYDWVISLEKPNGRY